MVFSIYFFFFLGGSQANDETVKSGTPLTTRRSKRIVSSESGAASVGSVSPSQSTKASSSTSSPAVQTVKKSPAMSLRERRFKRREATKNLSDGGVAATKAISSNPDTEANVSIAHNQNHDGASSSQNFSSDIELSNGVAVALQTETTPTKNRSTAIENCRQNLSAKICDLTKHNDDFIHETSKLNSTTPKLNGIVKIPENGIPRRSRKGIPHKLDISNGFDDSDMESSTSNEPTPINGIDDIKSKLPPPIATQQQQHQHTNGISNGTISRKRKISKSVSESESTSSWENKAPIDSQCLSTKSINSAIVLQPEHVLLKTPERRLKLTLRMKRSPMLDDLIESGTNLSDGSGNSACNTHYAPEYEVFRVEGLLDNSDDDSFDTSSSPSKPQQKRKKRHKTKSRRRRHRKQSEQHRQYNMETNGTEEQSQHTNQSHLNHLLENHHHDQKQYQRESDKNHLDKLHYDNSDSKMQNRIRHINNSCNNCSDHCNSHILQKSSSHGQPMKRLRLIFGNETHTRDIPPITTQSSNTTTSSRLIPT